MKCPRKLLASGLALALSLGSLAFWRVRAAFGQGTEPAPSLRQGGDSRGKIVSNVSLIVVPVTVKDSSGELVTDLQRNDFRIFEDGIEQPIEVFSADPTPLVAAIVVDDDLKQSTAEKVQKSLESVASGFGPDDQASLWVFDAVPQKISDDFIADNDKLLTALKRVQLSSSIPGMGSYAMTAGPRVNTSSMPGPLETPPENNRPPITKHIDDAVYEAGQQLQDRPRDMRRIIFLISDGQNAKNNTHKYDETLRLLLSSDISVYAVGVGEANLNRGTTKLGNNVLAKYARATGGDIFYGGVTRANLEELYARVSEQARHQYTLAYSGAHSDRSKPYHSIEVRVKRPGLSLLARDGYYQNATP